MNTDGHGFNRGEHLFWTPEKWRELQRRRIVEHLERAGRSGLYAGKGVLEMAREIGFSSSVNGVFGKLPFTTKDDLARAGNGAWGVKREEVAEWVCTSGTMGKAVDVPLTTGDLDRLAENEAVALGVAGVGRGDLVMLAVGMERMFVAGLAYWLGARKLGAACVRAGPHVTGDSRMLSELVGRLGADGQKVFVIAVPSFLAEVDMPPCGISGVIAIGEPVRGEDLESNEISRRISNRLACAVMSTYALTETCTTFAEGPMCKGGHLNPALAVLEVVDENGDAVKDGEVGEVVVTPLGMEGMPLMRFRTGDMAATFSAACPCGRTTPRVGPIVGRRQQLLKVRGTSVYPAAILEAVRGVEGVLECVVVAEREENVGMLSDRVVVFVQVRGDRAALRGAVENRLRAVLRVTPEVRVVEEAELRTLMLSGGRKGRRFVDRRF